MRRHKQVIGVQDGAIARHLDDDALHLGQLLDRVDAASIRDDPR